MDSYDQSLRPKDKIQKILARGRMMMRICKICGEEVYAGFYAYDDYYCDFDCLEEDYLEEEWNKLHDENPDEFYWTTFED